MKNVISLESCNTSHVDNGDKYSLNMQQLAKNEVMPYMGDSNKLRSTREAYGHMFIVKILMVDPTTCVLSVCYL